MFGEAKVGDVRLILCIDDDVGRFQVPVQDALAMRVATAPGNDLHQTRSALDGQWPSWTGSLKVEPAT
jgi:hypothetical protein